MNNNGGTHNYTGVTEVYDATSTTTHNGTLNVENINIVNQSSLVLVNGIIVSAASYTASNNDYVVVTNSASDTTITLPLGVNGDVVKVKKLT